VVHRPVAGVDGGRVEGLSFEHLFELPTFEPEPVGMSGPLSRGTSPASLGAYPTDDLRIRESSAPLAAGTAGVRVRGPSRTRWWSMFSPRSLPAEVDAVLADVRGWLPAVEATNTADERAAWLVGLRQLADATEAVFVAALRRFDAHGDGEALHGARSTSAWLQGGLHLAPGDASERVRIARGSGGHLHRPVTAMAKGTVTFDQVRAIDRSVRDLPAQSRDAAVELLTELAGRVDTGRLRAAGRALRHTVDPDGGQAEAQAQFDRRYLYLSPLLDGMTAVDGLLDGEATAILASALAPHLVPTDPSDDRSASQRRADGLVELARTAVAAGDLPVLSGTQVHLDVVVPLERLVGDERVRPAEVHLPVGGRQPLGDDTLRRWACDATVARIVLGPDSAPLDVGRDQRLFSPTQRRALAIRDAGCRFPGCGRAARYTDAHHVVSWVEGGRTDLANATLLCRFHHRLVHEGGWRMTFDHPGAGSHAALTLHGPQGQRLTSTPRGP